MFSAEKLLQLLSSLWSVKSKSFLMLSSEMLLSTGQDLLKTLHLAALKSSPEANYLPHALRGFRFRFPEAVNL
jgi:hypothetical protein